MKKSFYTDDEITIANQLLENGYIIKQVDDHTLLDEIKMRVVEIACDKLSHPMPYDPEVFLSTIHNIVRPDQLNDLRLFVFRKLNEINEIRPTYFALAKSLLNDVVGNELAMQNKVNLSIQMPTDNSSLLDIHSDIYGGESPFQIVQWLPLVSVSKTQSMFILPTEKTKQVAIEYKSIGNMSSLYERVKDDLIWLDIPYGKVLVFDSSCLHGNIVNLEKNSRWSLNCRFKGLFTPYVSAEKKLGSFYLPITTKVASKVGLNYRQPDGFEE